jgi:hypothetical protein
MRRPLLVAAAATAALGLPGRAFAHAGGSAPIATDFTARIIGLSPPSRAIVARVLDGDRLLWLRVAPGATAVVRGALGEPILRFDRDGVFANAASPTAWSDRILRNGPHRGWRRLTGDDAYAWHEHRLHAREPLASGSRTAASLGGWSVPLVVDGRVHVLHGSLDYRPPVSPWPWLGVATALATCTTALGLHRRRRLVAVAAAVPACALVWIVRAARELYPRPFLGVGNYVAVAGSCLVGAVLVRGLVSRDGDVRVFTAMLVGLGAAYEAATMLPVLWHATALTLLPSSIARALVTALLGCGIGALLLALIDQLQSVDRRTRTYDTLQET